MAQTLIYPITHDGTAIIKEKGSTLRVNFMLYDGKGNLIKDPLVGTVSEITGAQTESLNVVFDESIGAHPVVFADPYDTNSAYKISIVGQPSEHVAELYSYAGAQDTGVFYGTHEVDLAREIALKAGGGGGVAPAPFDVPAWYLKLTATAPTQSGTVSLPPPPPGGAYQWVNLGTSGTTPVGTPGIGDAVSVAFGNKVLVGRVQNTSPYSLYFDIVGANPKRLYGIEVNLTKTSDEFTIDQAAIVSHWLWSGAVYPGVTPPNPIALMGDVVAGDPIPIKWPDGTYETRTVKSNNGTVIEVTAENTNLPWGEIDFDIHFDRAATSGEHNVTFKGLTPNKSYKLAWVQFGAGTLAFWRMPNYLNGSAGASGTFERSITVQNGLDEIDSNAASPERNCMFLIFDDNFDIWTLVDAADNNKVTNINQFVEAAEAWVSGLVRFDKGTAAPINIQNTAWFQGQYMGHPGNTHIALQNGIIYSHDKSESFDINDPWPAWFIGTQFVTIDTTTTPLDPANVDIYGFVDPYTLEIANGATDLGYLAVVDMYGGYQIIDTTYRVPLPAPNWNGQMDLDGSEMNWTQITNGRVMREQPDTTVPSTPQKGDILWVYDTNSKHHKMQIVSIAKTLGGGIAGTTFTVEPYMTSEGDVNVVFSNNDWQTWFSRIDQLAIYASNDSIRQAVVNDSAVEIKRRGAVIADIWALDAIKESIDTIHFYGPDANSQTQFIGTLHLIEKNGPSVLTPSLGLWHSLTGNDTHIDSEIMFIDSGQPASSDLGMSVSFNPNDVDIHTKRGETVNLKGLTQNQADALLITNYNTYTNSITDDYGFYNREVLRVRTEPPFTTVVPDTRPQTVTLETTLNKPSLGQNLDVQGTDVVNVLALDINGFPRCPRQGDIVHIYKKQGAAIEWSGLASINNYTQISGQIQYQDAGFELYIMEVWDPSGITFGTYVGRFDNVGDLPTSGVLNNFATITNGPNGVPARYVDDGTLWHWDLDYVTTGFQDLDTATDGLARVSVNGAWATLNSKIPKVGKVYKPDSKTLKIEVDAAFNAMVRVYNSTTGADLTASSTSYAAGVLTATFAADLPSEVGVFIDY